MRKFILLNEIDSNKTYTINVDNILFYTEDDTMKHSFVNCGGLSAYLHVKESVQTIDKLIEGGKNA